MIKKAVLCLSSGLDSTVSFLWALKNCDEVYALFFNYGQKALKKERQMSFALCKKYGVTCQEIDLSFLGEVSGSALNSDKAKIPTESVNIESDKASSETAKAVWVPNRNGLFINVAASVAEAKKFDGLLLGFNKEEAKSFPDNSEDFLQASNRALDFSTQKKVKLFSPTLDLNKKEIYKMGLDLGMDDSMLWPCYFDGDEICGLCESCKRFLRAKLEHNKEVS